MYQKNQWIVPETSQLPVYHHEREEWFKVWLCRPLLSAEGTRLQKTLQREFWRWPLFLMLSDRPVWGYLFRIISVWWCCFDEDGFQWWASYTTCAWSSNYQSREWNIERNVNLPSSSSSSWLRHHQNDRFPRRILEVCKTCQSQQAANKPHHLSWEKNLTFLQGSNTVPTTLLPRYTTWNIYSSNKWPMPKHLSKSGRSRP